MRENERQPAPGVHPRRSTTPKAERSLQRRRNRARVGVEASKLTGDILPRRIYELSKTEALDDATNHTQQAVELK